MGNNVRKEKEKEKEEKTLTFPLHHKTLQNELRRLTSHIPELTSPPTPAAFILFDCWATPYII